MWQTKYASAVPKNLGLGLNSRRAVKAISSLGVHSLWILLFKKDQNLLQSKVTPLAVTPLKGCKLANFGKINNDSGFAWFLSLLKL